MWDGAEPYEKLPNIVSLLSNVEMDVDGAAQDESVSGGPGQAASGVRPQSPSGSASGSSSSSSPSDAHMPVAENWCHTQVSCSPKLAQCRMPSNKADRARLSGKAVFGFRCLTFQSVVGLSVGRLTRFFARLRCANLSLLHLPLWQSLV